MKLNPEISGCAKSDKFAGLGTLGRSDRPITVFFRDDDAGWDDQRLIALLDCFSQARAPIDLAVIPNALGADLVRELNARHDSSTAGIGLHQHGWQHQSHETRERKSEFGPARAISAQRVDIIAGRQRLLDCFGERLDPIFTPPWNRCTPASAALLADLGFAALSRDRSAPAQSSLPELSVDIDWCKQWRISSDASDFAARLTKQILACASAGGPIGIMLHHAQMGDDELLLLTELLAQFRQFRHLRFVSMRTLLETTNDPSTPTLQTGSLQQHEELL